MKFQKISYSEFKALLPRIKEIYFAAFSATMRRPLLCTHTSDFDDDGQLGNVSIEEFILTNTCTFHGYFAEQSLQGIGVSFHIAENVLFADYLALDPSQADLVGKGRLIIKAWLASCKEKDQDVFIDIEYPAAETDSHPPHAERDATQRKFRQRILMQQRLGYQILYDHPFSPVPGQHTLLAVNPKPSRASVMRDGRAQALFAPGELESIIAKIKACHSATDSTH